MTGLFVIRFDGAEQAERRIAGAAVAAHLVAQACRTGARDIRVTTASGANLSDRAWADIHRACPSARFDGYDGGPGLCASGRVLVSAAALDQFI